MEETDVTRPQLLHTHIVGAFTSACVLLVVMLVV